MKVMEIHTGKDIDVEDKGSTDKFGTTILTHLFCPTKKSTPIWQTSFYQCFLRLCGEKRRGALPLICEGYYELPYNYIF